jgi:predicted nucleic acid-binding protein
LIINPVVYAELSVRFDRIEDIDTALKDAVIDLLEIPTAALFLAGKAFQRYRASGGKLNGVLPDFFIGAHAAVLGIPLLTRDISRYGAYFPTVEIIAPRRQPTRRQEAEK